MLSLRQTEKSRRSQMRRPFPTKELGEPTSAWRDSPRWTIRTRPHILSSFDCLRIRSRHCREDSLARREVRGDGTTYVSCSHGSIFMLSVSVTTTRKSCWLISTGRTTSWCWKNLTSGTCSRTILFQNRSPRLPLTGSSSRRLPSRQRCSGSTSLQWILGAHLSSAPPAWSGSRRPLRRGSTGVGAAEKTCKETSIRRSSSRGSASSSNEED